MRYKKEILSVQEFYELAPDMIVHSEQTIQGAIYRSATLLNSICNDLISQVWDYNNPGGVDGEYTVPDPTNPLYRTLFQLGAIKDAFVAQTQYTINLGNDYAVGGGSYSIGNINNSFSRPENLDILAPGVLTLLQSANVYQINSFVNNKPTKKCDDGFFNFYPPSTIENVTFETGDERYVQQYQPNVKPNSILSVDNNFKTVWIAKEKFDNNADEIKDADGAYRELKDTIVIHNINQDISSNTEQINSVKTNVSQVEQELERQDTTITTLNNDLGELGEQVQNIQSEVNTVKTIQTSHSKELLINDFQIQKLNSYIESGYLVRYRGEWNSNELYEMNDIVDYQTLTYIAKEQNSGIVPTNTTYWKQHEITQQIDLSNYYDKSEIDSQISNCAKLAYSNTFAEMNEFESGIRVATTTITPYSARFGQQATFRDSVDIQQNLNVSGTIRANFLYVNGRPPLYANATVLSPSRLTWIYTIENYGWCYGARVDNFGYGNVYGCSIKWKSNASNNFKFKIVANAWIENNTLFVHLQYAKTAGGDEYNSIIGSIQSIQILWIE